MFCSVINRIISALALSAISSVLCGCSVFSPSRQDTVLIPATIFDPNPNEIIFGEENYFQEVRMDSIIEILHPQSYAIFHGVVSPMPKDIVVMLIKAQTIEDYIHKYNPFFWAYSNVNHFIDEYQGLNNYGMYSSLEISDSLLSIQKFPSQCEYLFLPVKRDSISNIANLIKDGGSIFILKGKTSGDTIWAACYYRKNLVDYSLLLSFKQRDSVANSWKEAAENYVDDSLSNSIHIHNNISADSLSHFHNKVIIQRVSEITNDTDNCKPLVMDSLSYKSYLTEYSIQNSVLSLALERKGMMHIDSILYGVNVIKIIVSQDTNRYVVYSIIPDGKKTKNGNRKRERIFEGKMYYMELTPYFNTESTDYHNRGLYVNGFVVKDYELLLQEWKNVYTTNSLEGYYYYTKRKK